MGTSDEVRLMERRSRLEAKIFVLKDQILKRIEETHGTIESLRAARLGDDEDITLAISMVALTTIIFNETNREVLVMAHDLKDTAEELEGLRNG